MTVRVIIRGFFFFLKYGVIQDQKTSHHKISLKCEFKVGKDEAFTRLMQLILLINYRLKIHTQRLISLLLWRVRSEKLFFSSGVPSDKVAWKAPSLYYIPVNTKSLQEECHML